MANGLWNVSLLNIVLDFYLVIVLYFLFPQTEEILEVDGRSYVPSMKIAEMHNIGIKGKGVRVVIIANTPVNCLHTSIRSRCVSRYFLVYRL